MQICLNVVIIFLQCLSVHSNFNAHGIVSITSLSINLISLKIGIASTSRLEQAVKLALYQT